MSSRIAELREEADESLGSVWFVQRLDEVERTDVTLSLRLHIRPGLFVQVFCGERSGALYFALIDGEQRIFGIDCERGEWHVHPFGASQEHQVLAIGLDPMPLRIFLAQVEELLLAHEIL